MIKKELFIKILFMALSLTISTFASTQAHADDGTQTVYGLNYEENWLENLNQFALENNNTLFMTLVGLCSVFVLLLIFRRYK